MNVDFALSIAEARALAIDPNPDCLALNMAAEERREAIADLLNACQVAKRDLNADEQKAYDAFRSQFSELGQLLSLAKSKRDAYNANLDKARAPWAHVIQPKIDGTSRRASSTDLGDAFAEAVAEVRSGKVATAYVDFPEVRTVSESGAGGYGVPTVIAEPVEALAAKSVVMSLPGVVKVNATHGDRIRFPRFNAVTVGGTAENETLTAAATDLDAIDVVFQKFSTYETLSTELEEDFASPALEVLGHRMLKDLAIKVDSGLLQGTGNADVVGLFAQSGVSSTSVAALPTDFDKVSEAVYQLELNDGNPTAWVMHPRTWRIYKQVKTGISSDKTTLLEPDPQSAPKSLQGLPVFTTTSISIVSGATSVGSTAAVLDTSQIVVVTRRPARLEISRDFKFDVDQVAIRATTRVGLGVLDAAGGISLLTDIRAS